MLNKESNKYRNVDDVPLSHRDVIKFCYQRRKKKDKGRSIQLPSISDSGTFDREPSGEEIAGVLLVASKKDKIADSEGSKGGSSAESSRGRGGRNKRKSADPSLQIPINLPPSLTEIPRYEQNAGKSKNLLSNLMASEAGSSQSKEDPTEECESAEWDEPFVRTLQDLLSSGLHTLFKIAIKKIADCGYSEDVAEKFISRHALYCGSEDIVSSIVNGTLANLKKGTKGIGAPGEEVFEDMQQMVDFTMLEMINVLREVKPPLSIEEAMWRLLMCDLNIAQACALEGDLSSFLDGKDVAEGSSFDSTPSLLKSDAQGSKNIPKNTSEPHFSKPETLKSGSFPNLPKPTNPSALKELPPGSDSPDSAAESVEKSLSSLGEQVQSMSLTQTSEERSRTGRKGRGKKGSVVLRQKLFHGYTETYKKLGKGAVRSGQLTKVGNFPMEQRIKNPSELPAVHSKGASSKISTKPVAAASSAGGGRSVSTSTQLAAVSDSSSTVSTQGIVTALPAPNSELVVSSSSEKKGAPKAEASISKPSKMPNYFAGIPFDESLGKYVPQSSKDEQLLNLVPRLHDLQNERNNWTEWANQKVMQAARRLSKDQPELKALRKEKLELEQSEKEKLALEENSMKRLFEMEAALHNASGQAEKSNSTILRLEEERSILEMQMQDAKLQAADTAVTCQKTREREQKALKNAQSIDGERALLQEELETLKKKAVELQQQMGKANNLYSQTEARYEWERMEKEKYLAQAAAISKEREQLEAAAKAEEDRIKRRAETEKKKYLVDIKKLESQLSLLKYRADAAKIAALRGSLDGGFGGFAPGSSSSATPPTTGYQIPGSSRRGINHTENAATGALKQERECAMCMEEEKSVVFLPCAHQVFCPKCSELHEKQGMNDCPSCRAPIQRRINVLFPPRRKP